MSNRIAFAYGCSDAVNHKAYADTLQCKIHLKLFRAAYNKGWHTTRDMLINQKRIK